MPLLTDFAEAHERALGMPYLIRLARDSAHLKAALNTYEESTIRRALMAYFADVAARMKFGANVPVFVDRIATLASGRGARVPVPLALPAPITRGPSEPTQLGNIIAGIVPSRRKEER